MLPVQRAQRPENMRQNTLARGAAIGIGAGGVPAKALEKPVQLALRMVKASSAGPAVGAAVDRLIAAARLDRAQLARQQVQGHLPADFDKGLFYLALLVTPARAGDSRRAPPDGECAFGWSPRRGSDWPMREGFLSRGTGLTATISPSRLSTCQVPQCITV